MSTHAMLQPVAPPLAHPCRWLPAALLLTLALAAGPAGAGAPGALASARSIRSLGCAGHPGTRAPLRGNGLLDAAAARWARGATLSAAIEYSGYRADQSAALHVRNAAAQPGALARALALNLCAPLLDAANEDLGSFQAGGELWLIAAAPFVAPAAADRDRVAFEVLQLVNRARALPRLCGHRQFQAAAALRLDPQLDAAALAHAQDMLRFGYFEHTGRDGSTPGTRVAATGYRYRLVGENIAEGPQTPREVVQGWIESPGHCQNIMDPRFTDMGLGFAANAAGRPRIEWVQELGAHR